MNLLHDLVFDSMHGTNVVRNGLRKKLREIVTSYVYLIDVGREAQLCRAIVSSIDFTFDRGTR